MPTLPRACHEDQTHGPAQDPVPCTPVPASPFRANLTLQGLGDAEPPKWVCRRHASCYPAVLSGHLLPSLQLRVGPVVIVSWARTREGKPHGLHPAHRSALSGPPIWPWPFVSRAGIDETVQGNELAGTRGPVLNAASLKTWHAARPRGVGVSTTPPLSGAGDEEPVSSCPAAHGACVVFSALWVNTGRAQPPMMQTAQRPQMDGEMQQGPCVDGIRLSHEQERSSDACCPVHGLWGHDTPMRSQTHRAGHVWSCRKGKCPETGKETGGSHQLGRGTGSPLGGWKVLEIEMAVPQRCEPASALSLYVLNT